MRLLHAET
jgi:enoyl-CoA hydratase